MVELEVAHMNDQPGRRGNPQSHGIGDRMADVEKLHLERTDLDRRAGFHGVEHSLAGRVVARQFDLDQAHGQRRPVDRDRDLIQHMVDRADVIFVPVGDDNSHHLVRLFA